MMEPVLEVADLRVSFGGTVAVDGFSCRIMPAETLGLVGESGCGKSSVALGIMRDLGRGSVLSGSVRFMGRELTTMPERELQRIRGSGIAMIYQEPMSALNPAMRIGAQLAEVPVLHRTADRKAAWAMARQMVVDVGLPDPDRILQAYPHELSGGQQQRIVIAMALMADPALLILDEPTTALDVTVAAGIIDLLRDLGARRGTAMLFISHNLGLVTEVCDRICVMYSGEAVETGPALDRPRHPYTQALLQAMPVPGPGRPSHRLRAIPGHPERTGSCNFGPRCDHFIAGLCDAGPVPMVDGVRCLRVDSFVPTSPDPLPQDRAASGEVILQVRDLKKHYPAKRGVVRANEAVSFDLAAGETLAIVGESGCGKSTLAKVLMGLEVATAGTILLDGREIQNLPVQKRDTASVAAMQMVFQNPFDTLNPAMRVGRQIRRTLDILKGQAGVGRLLDLVRLPRAFAERHPHQLSGGQKQRVGIARAIAGNARVVVADEPVSALDVSVQAAVADVLMDIRDRDCMAMIFISHDLAIIRYVADRVLVMYLGHVVETGTVAQVFAAPYHPYTEALLSAVPVADPRQRRKRIVLEGEIPSAVNPPSGCPFQTRCHRKSQVPGGRCDTEMPPMQILQGGHQIKCHLSADILAGMEGVFSPSSRYVSADGTGCGTSAP